MKNNEIKNTNSRRSFMKKAAYAVPTVIAISQLTNPVTAAAATASSVKYQLGGQESNPTNTSAGTDRGDAYSIFGKKD